MEKKHWQIAENEKTDDSFDLRSLEASGHATEKTMFVANEDDRKREEEDEDRIHKEDWGDVDPQPDTGRDPMDPSGPGSAV
jgi:hypothetical protein